MSAEGHPTDAADDDDLENDDREERLGGVVERSLTVGWQSLHRVSMNHLVCPLIPTSPLLPSQYPLKACKPL